MEAVMTQMYERSRRQLRAVAARYVGDEADDLVQDAFLSALRSSGTYRGDAAPLTWLHRILMNACISHCRKHDVRQYAHVVRERYPLAAAATAENTAALRMALRQLPTGQYRVFVMYEVIGYTHSEIARRLAIRSGTSRGRLAEARRRLQQLLGPRQRTVKPRRRHVVTQ